MQLMQKNVSWLHLGRAICVHQCIIYVLGGVFASRSRLCCSPSSFKDPFRSFKIKFSDRISASQSLKAPWGLLLNTRSYLVIC